jgi:hypothetical protein
VEERLILAAFGRSSTKPIELILFILGSWWVIVADTFFLLTLASVELDGSRRVAAVSLSR